MIQDFNKDWTFWSKDSASKSVTLPHDAMQEEMRLADAPSGSAGAYFQGGIYNYEKKFYVSEEWREKSIYVHFEGIYRKSEIWVNGILTAKCSNGYRAFWVELDSCLKYGMENVITVIADNQNQPNSRWYSGSGIYRPVWLSVKSQKHILPEGVKVTTVSCNPAVVRVETEHVGGKVEIEIYDGARRVAHAEGDRAEIPIFDAKLWSDKEPKLYICKVKLIDEATFVDEESISFGIRELKWSTKGLFVNGQETLLRGGCIHHDNGILGARCYKESEYRKVKILKESGFNAIRSAHNPISEAMLKACDEYGIYVMDETWDHWYTHKNPYDYAGEFLDEYEQDLQSIVKKDYNHPSVIMYSIGNEVTEPASPEGVAFCRELVQKLHALDGMRPITIGLNLLILTMRAKGFNHRDTGAQNETKQDAKVVNGSKQFNNQVTMETGKMMNQSTASPQIDQVTSPCLDMVDIAGYNYASGRYPLEGTVHPERIVVGSETFPSDIYQNWQMVKQYPYLIGDFMWTAWDYLGEVGVGSWGYGEEGKLREKPYPWLLAESGTHDILGNAQGEMAYVQCVWGMREKPYIGVRPINHAGEEVTKSAWRKTDAMASWSWKGCEGRMAEIEVYTNSQTDRVKLYLDDTLVGDEKVSELQADFQVAYKPGILKAVALDEIGREVGETSLVSASSEIRAALHPEKKEAVCGEVIYVPVVIEDGCGIQECNADTKVHVSVVGGELLAFGSARPRTEERYLDGACTTYYGRALAVVRADEATEEVKICVTADDILGEEVSIKLTV